MAANDHSAGADTTYRLDSFTPRLEPQVQRVIHEIEFNQTPLLSLTPTARVESVKAMKGTFQEEAPIQWVGTLAEALDSSETGVDLVDASFVIAGMIAQVVETGEQMLVSSKATNTLTVVRGYGQTAAAAASNGGQINFLAATYRDSDARIQTQMRAPNMMSWTNADIAQAFAISRWMQNTAVYGPAEAMRLERQSIAEHKKKIERALLFAEPREDTSSEATYRYVNTSLRYWCGLYRRHNFGGGVTMRGIRAQLASLMRYKRSSNLIIMGGQRIWEIFSELPHTYLQVNATESDKSVGNSIEMIKANGISAKFVLNSFFDEGGWDDQALVYDPYYLYITEFLPYTLQRNVQTPGDQRMQNQMNRAVGVKYVMPQCAMLWEGMDHAA